jgi:hypothetical protein
MALAAVFASTLLLAFGFTLFVAGLFGARFGAGKSRGVGFVLSLVGLLIVAIFAGLTWELIPGVTPMFDPDVIASSLIAVLAATLGSLVAISAFVAAVMKS